MDMERLNSYNSIRLFLVEELRRFELGKISNDKMKTTVHACKVLAELIENEANKKGDKNG